MKRFYGMMPCDEIEKEVQYKDNHNMNCLIQAGPNGWTVIFADSSTRYKDNVATTEKNFNEAYQVASEAVGPLKVVNKPAKFDVAVENASDTCCECDEAYDMCESDACDCDGPCEVCKCKETDESTEN